MAFAILRFTPTNEFAGSLAGLCGTFPSRRISTKPFASTWPRRAGRKDPCPLWSGKPFLATSSPRLPQKPRKRFDPPVCLKRNSTTSLRMRSSGPRLSRGEISEALFTPTTIFLWPSVKPENVSKNPQLLPFAREFPRHRVRPIE